jgi:hypothetical protein
LTNRLLITVSVTIACGPLPDTPFDSGAAVSLQQAAGEHISAASGSVYNAFTGQTHRCSHVTVSHKTP